MMQAARRSSAANEEMMVVVLLMFFCVAMVIAAIGFYLTGQDQEGTPCKGDDENAEYERDDEGDCVYKGCKIGYAVDEDGICVFDQSGKDCEGSDPNAIYETNVSNVCSFVSCNYGYNIDEDGNCVEVEDDGGSGNGSSGSGADGGGGGGDASGGGGGDASGGGGGEIEDGNYRIIFPGVNGGLNHHNGYAIARRDITADIWKITHIDGGTNYTIQRPDNWYLIYPADTTKGQYAWCCHQYDVPPDNSIFNIQKIDDDNTYNFKSKDGNQIFGNTSPDNENYGGTLYGSVETDPASVYDRWEPNFKIEPA